MRESKGPLDRATSRLGELVHLLKHNVIPGMRPKDQKTILEYLLAMVEDLETAHEEIKQHKVTDNEKRRIEDDIRKEYERKAQQDRNALLDVMRKERAEALVEQERELREEFTDAIISQHTGDWDDE